MLNLLVHWVIQTIPMFNGSVEFDRMISSTNAVLPKFACITN
jgi:hypothetical protein